MIVYWSILGGGLIDFPFYSLIECLILSFKGKEVTSVLYGAIVSVALYLYLMHYVTDEAQRLTNLGVACVFFTIAMQASPLAAVVCMFVL